ncbi:hypothetical protein BJ165DRAFT_1470353 [Panaeolus papilionaceus]|nr:hypothetical protein BJ165DRAFT_1470353 [Panaeolus papilionaceus]
MPINIYARNSAFKSRAKSQKPYYLNPRPQPSPRMMEGLEGTPTALTVPRNQDHKERIIISDAKLIGSYNWATNAVDEPTIIVPGSPVYWKERPLPYSVQPDTGAWPVDEHMLRLPSAPFLPLVVAVNQVQQEQRNPPFDWSSVNFITSRNALRNLTRWARGQSQDDFRIDLDLVGEKTVLLNRWSVPNTDGQFWGNTFGTNFEKESTVAGENCENAARNIRVISYVSTPLSENLLITYQSF